MPNRFAIDPFGLQISRGSDCYSRFAFQISPVAGCRIHIYPGKLCRFFLPHAHLISSKTKKKYTAKKSLLNDFASSRFILPPAFLIPFFANIPNHKSISFFVTDHDTQNTRGVHTHTHTHTRIRVTWARQLITAHQIPKTLTRSTSSPSVDRMVDFLFCTSWLQHISHLCI